MGTDLVGSLAEVSTEAENALASLHQLIPVLLKLASSTAAQNASKDAENVQAAAFRAIQRYLGLCSRLRCSPPHLSAIQVRAPCSQEYQHLKNG